MNRRAAGYTQIVTVTALSTLSILVLMVGASARAAVTQAHQSATTTQARLAAHEAVSAADGAWAMLRSGAAAEHGRLGACRPDLPCVHLVRKDAADVVVAVSDTGHPPVDVEVPTPQAGTQIPLAAVRLAP